MYKKRAPQRSYTGIDRVVSYYISRFHFLKEKRGIVWLRIN